MEAILFVDLLEWRFLLHVLRVTGRQACNILESETGGMTVYKCSGKADIQIHFHISVLSFLSCENYLWLIDKNRENLSARLELIHKNEVL